MLETTIKPSNPLAVEKVSKLMVKFAIPSIVAMVVSAMYNIIDQLFIGQAVGTLGNAATNIAFPLTTSCVAIALLFGIGGASCFNLSMGSGKKERAPYFIGNSVLVLALSGIILCVLTVLLLTPLLKLFGSPDDVLPYAKEYVRITAFGFPFLILTTGGGHLIRADGSPNIMMICNIVGTVINIALDALFVLELNMGMAGAAYATIIGQFISALIVLVYFFKYFKTVPLLKKHFAPNFKFISKIVSIGIASFFNQMAMMVVQIVLNNLLKHYGALSIYGESIPIACAGIVMKVNQLVFAIVIGLGQGTQPIISFNYGARQYKRVKQAYLFAATIGLIISVIAFFMFQIFPREIISLFGDGSELYFQLSEKFFRIFLFFTWLNCLQPITTTFFSSIGKPIKGVFISLTRQIIFFLPILIILPHFFGINGIIYTGPSADLLSAIVTILMTYIEFKSMNRMEAKIKAE
jgi:putative MATE family efflux protein